eukprot:TRINITY_DN16796_c0_g5_i1.p1 TRINITY_DN16796_c0_g5~~TRINITY_DN16796_c0_g5_i1.p1  ORF type:complete len:918 (-),score=187.21 TRINITY_DN16796_c0_g5_i1:76-2829(-)
MADIKDGINEGGRAQNSNPSESVPTCADSEPLKLEDATHGSGACEVLYLSSNGRHLLTSGSDGRIASFNVAAEHPTREWAQKLSSGIGATGASAVSPDGNWLAMAEETESGFHVWVKGLDKDGRILAPSAQKPRSAGRYTLDVRHLCWHSTLPHLCIATDDGKVDVWSDTNRLPESAGSSKPSRRQLCRASSEGGARCASFDPRGELVAAAFASGQLVIFDFESCQEIYRTKAFPKTIIGKEHASMSWHPEGESLAVPGETFVRLFNRTDFTQSPRSLEGGHRFSTTAVSWASSSELLASASFDAVALWRQEKLTRVVRSEAQPSSFVWGGNGLLCVGTEAGSWGILKVGSEPPLAASLEASQATGETQQQAEAESIPADSSEQAQDVPVPPKVEADPAQAVSQELPSSAAEVQRETISSQKIVEPVRQKQFQPGATTKDSRRRFLAWNENGSLKVALPSAPAQSSSSSRRKKGIQESLCTVGVEYSKERGRASVREVKVPEGVCMGAIGPGNYVLAVSPTRTHPAKLCVHIATPWQKAQFDQELPSNETVQALTIGRSFVATFTSPCRLLRISTTSFIPLGVLALAGDVVCMAACEDLLFCVTEVPGPKNLLQEPMLEFVLYGVSRKEKLASGRLPLSARSTLRWIGFSVEAQPLSLDTSGVLRALVLSGGGDPLLSMAPGTWLPVAVLENQGRKLYPVRAEGGVLYCAELSKEGDEPKVGAVQKLTDVRYKLPFGSAAEWSERVLRHGLLSAHVNFAMGSDLLPASTKRAAREAPTKIRRGGSGAISSPITDWRHVLKLFEKTLKTGDLEQAFDVAKYFLAACELQQQVQLLEEAKALADTLNREEMANRLADLVTTRTSKEASDERRHDEADSVDVDEEVVNPADANSGTSAKRDAEEASMESPPTKVARIKLL